MIILPVTPIMFSTCADEVLPTVTIRIHGIRKWDDIEGSLEGEADWHYYVWVRTGEKYLQSDKKCERDHDEIWFEDTYTFKVETVSIYFGFFLLEEDFWSAWDLADISSYPGGGYDDYTSNIPPRGAVYNASYDLKTSWLAGGDMSLLGIRGQRLTSGDMDGSKGVDENDAELWFTISDNYEPPVARAAIRSDQPIHTGDIVIFEGPLSTASNGSSITKFEWDFESDGLVDAEGGKTTFTYNKKGNYTATLKVTDSLGEISTDTCTIEVLNCLPTPSFAYTPSAPTIQNETRFYDASEDKDGTIDSWFWDFGDGATSAEKDPTHQYSDKGKYNVQLKVTDDDGGSNTVTISVTVYNIAPSSDFTFSPNTPETGENVKFTDASSDPENKLSSWSWSFGDGNSSTEQNPTHAYQKDGTYTVTLTAQDDEGVTSTKSKSITVTIPRGIIGGPGWIDDFVVFGAIIAAVAGLSGIVVRSRKLKKKEGYRPTGVTVLAALEIISGIILSYVASALFPVGTLLLAYFGEFLLPLTLALIGDILPILGVLSFVVAYGYLKGKGWAWTLGLIHSIIEILLGIASLPIFLEVMRHVHNSLGDNAALTGLIYVALDGLIIYYLTRPYVKQFFGKA